MFVQLEDVTCLSSLIIEHILAEINFAWQIFGYLNKKMLPNLIFVIHICGQQF